MKTTLLFAAALAAVGAAPALAADLPAARAPVYAKAPAIVEPVYNWTGFYVGGTAGGAFGSFDPSTSTTAQGGASYFNTGNIPGVNAAGAQSIKPAGFTGGFEAGYNWQISNFVVGLEGDFEYLGQNGNAATSGVYAVSAPASFTVTSSASATWLATARARAGIASNDWLFFATGGAAFTNIKASFGFSDNCGAVFTCDGFLGPASNATEASAFSSTKTGFAVGGGIEKAIIGQNWTVKIEYLYVGFGTVTGTGVLTTGGLAGTQLMTHSYDLKDNIVRIGVNYKFGGPVVARY